MCDLTQYFSLVYIVLLGGKVYNLFSKEEVVVQFAVQTTTPPGRERGIDGVQLYNGVPPSVAISVTNASPDALMFLQTAPVRRTMAPRINRTKVTSQMHPTQYDLAIRVDWSQSVLAGLPPAER